MRQLGCEITRSQDVEKGERVLFFREKGKRQKSFLALRACVRADRDFDWTDDFFGVTTRNFLSICCVSLKFLDVVA